MNLRGPKSDQVCCVWHIAHLSHLSGKDFLEWLVDKVVKSGLNPFLNLKLLCKLQLEEWSEIWVLGKGFESKIASNT